MIFLWVFFMYFFSVSLYFRLQEQKKGRKAFHIFSSFVLGNLIYLQVFSRIQHLLSVFQLVWILIKKNLLFWMWTFRYARYIWMINFFVFEFIRMARDDDKLLVGRLKKSMIGQNVNTGNRTINFFTNSKCFYPIDIVTYVTVKIFHSKLSKIFFSNCQNFPI
jgi:hypothetical protein